jgi:hypothetical protein
LYGVQNSAPALLLNRSLQECLTLTCMNILICHILFFNFILSNVANMPQIYGDNT